MSDVFISYSRKDRPFVEQIHDGLKKRTRDVWVDWEDIPLTSDWWREITTAIENANTFVFIMSPDSCASPICNFEIAHAAMYNKRIIPIFYRPVNEDDTLEKLGMIKPNGMVQEILGARDLLSVASESLRTLTRYNWVNFGENHDFETVLDGLLAALDSDLPHTKVHTRLLVQALDWVQVNRNDSFLLNGEAVIQAEAWLQEAVHEQKSPEPTDLHQEYIAKSRAVEDSKIARQKQTELRTQRLRTASFMLVAVIVVTIIVTGVAVAGAMYAIDTAAEASFNAGLANTQVVQEQERAALASTQAVQEQERAAQASTQVAQEQERAASANTQAAQEQERAEQASSNESLANTQAAQASNNEALANTQAANARRQAANARSSNPFTSLTDTAAQSNSISTTIARSNSISTTIAQSNSISTSIAQSNAFRTSMAQMNSYNTSIARINSPNIPTPPQSSMVRRTATSLPITTPTPTIQVAKSNEANYGSVTSRSSQHWHYPGQVDEVLSITLRITNSEENPINLLVIVRDPDDDVLVDVLITVEYSDITATPENHDIQLDEFILNVAGIYDIEVRTIHETTVDYSLIIESR